MKTPVATTAEPLPDELARVGRYVIIDRIGAGGMGVVYRAYDPELDRKIAVKLLLPGRGSGQERLAREARAMARVSHPNVVPVHDVGSIGDQLFIAMEFVDGQSLAEWLRVQPRGAQEIVTIFRGAAAGLAAAHEVGVVHRDFKPDNVLVDRKGRPQVTDFGLAAGDLARNVDTDGSHDTDGSLDPPEITRLTRAGAAVGTPAYMAPEQFDGGSVDARSDQFSFCVALWEALWGQRPFQGATAGDLAWAVTHGEIKAPKAPTPTWLYQILVRGLSTDPAKRWPSMIELLAELELGRARTRRRRIGYAFLGALFVAGAIAGGLRYDRARRVSECEAAGDEISQTWNDDVKAKLRNGLLATGVSYAATTAEKAMPYFEAQAAAWRDARTEACLNTRVREIWDEETLDRSVWCLDERRMELEALLVELSQADTTSVQEAVTAASRLSQVGTCRDTHQLKALTPPPQDRGTIQLVMGTLSRAEALRAAGKYQQGLDAARNALTAAEDFGWPPLVATARLRCGYSLRDSGDFPAAQTAFEESYFVAAKVGALQVAADAAAELVFNAGKQARYDEGLRWFRHADIVLSTLEVDENSLRRSETLNNLAIVHHFQGAYQQARPLYERALAIRERVLGPDHPNVASSLGNLAALYTYMGEYDEAKALQMRVLAIVEKALGPDHPIFALNLNNLGHICFATGAYEEAIALHERALAIRETALDHNHPDIAASLNNLAAAYDSNGAFEKARPHLERALLILEATLGPDHPDIATSLNNLAGVHQSMGAYEEAIAIHGRALAIREKALGADHRDVGYSLSNLASVHYTTEAFDEAQALWRRALAVWEKALGPNHPDLAGPLNGLARIALRQLRPADAVPLAERALSLLQGENETPQFIARVRFILARALWAAPMGQGRDRLRAVALAQEARDVFRDAKGISKDLTEVDAFLANASRNVEED